MAVDLREAWAALIARRPGFRDVLAPYQPVLDAWAVWAPGDLVPLVAGADACRDLWRRGIPLIAGAGVASPPAAAVETGLAAALHAVLRIAPDRRPGLERLAEAWSHGEVGTATLIPARGAVGDGGIERLTGLPAAVVGFLACAALRPALEHSLGPCRAHLGDADWKRGVCPFCGAPPGFSDVGETGARLLVCHVCGGAWRFGRFVCPGCGTERSEDLARLTVENDPKEEGYALAVCAACRTYVKELDRRVRWNAGPPLVEDWGSPHLDLLASRAGYARGMPTLLTLRDRATAVPEEPGAAARVVGGRGQAGV